MLGFARDSPVMKRTVFALAAAAAITAPTQAGTLEISVRDTAGKPLRDAVVTVHAPGRTPAATRFPWPAQVTQQDIQFNPFVLVVPVGAEVSFPNKDKVRHHVYSFSKPKKFELKLYGREDARTVTFDKAGAVALGCNIHDGMTGFVKVVDTPWAAKTDERGVARVAGLPAGQASVAVWHPYARLKNNESVLTVSLPPSGNVARSVSLPIALPR